MLKEEDIVPGELSGMVVVQTVHGFLEKEENLKNLFKKQTVLLYFYPKDMTPGCITEATGFQASLPEFNKLKVRIIGCSRDTAKLHCGFIEKKSLAFELISDTSGSITEAFGVWAEKSMYGKKFMGIIRSSFIIENGKIIKVYPKVNVKNHAQEVLEFLKSRK
jgi:peroxiredoxin Q/BCP